METGSHRGTDGGDLTARCLTEAAREVAGAAAGLRAVPDGPGGVPLWRSAAGTAFRRDVLALAGTLDALADDLAGCAEAWRRHADAVEATRHLLRGVVPVPGLPSGWGL